MIIQLSKEDKHFLLELTRALTVALSMSSPRVDTKAAGKEANRILYRAEEWANVAPIPPIGKIRKLDEYESVFTESSED